MTPQLRFVNYDSLVQNLNEKREEETEKEVQQAQTPQQDRQEHRLKSFEEDLGKMRERQEALDSKIKFLESQIEKGEIDRANIKINYIAAVVAVLAYIFFDRYHIRVFGYTVSPIAGSIVTVLALELFLIKENVLYSKHLIRKFLFVRK